MSRIKLEGKPGMTTIHFGNTPVYGARYSANKADYDTINKFCTAQSKAMYKRGLRGYIYVNTMCGASVQDWRTSERFKIGDTIFIYSGEQTYDNPKDRIKYTNLKYNKFIMYFQKMAPEEMGCDGGHNDCLHDCLKQFYGNDRMKIPRTRVNSGKKLKEFLGLDRDELVPINKLQEVADYLKINIEVQGDHAMKTTGDHARTMSLEMLEGHVETKKT